MKTRRQLVVRASAVQAPGAETFDFQVPNARLIGINANVTVVNAGGTLTVTVAFRDDTAAADPAFVTFGTSAVAGAVGDFPVKDNDTTVVRFSPISNAIRITGTVAVANVTYSLTLFVEDDL